MKQRHEKFAKKGRNPHDQTGGAVGVCPKCKAEVPPKPGFRVSSVKCPKCGASMGKL
jgi:predicted RNA-binding Zn-ribbon protein involved in translation (DUF1610 family)